MGNVKKEKKKRKLGINTNSATITTAIINGLSHAFASVREKRRTGLTFCAQVGIFHIFLVLYSRPDVRRYQHRIFPPMMFRVSPHDSIYRAVFVQNCYVMVFIRRLLLSN